MDGNGIATSGATMSSTQGVRPVQNEISHKQMDQVEVEDHVSMDEMRQRSPEKTRNGSNIFGLKIEKSVLGSSEKVLGVFPNGTR
jgi:hypothetical protein